MTHPRPTPRALVRVVSGLAALLLGISILGVATPAQAAFAKPSGLTAESTATTSVRLKWKPVSKAPAYRIKYDDNSSMKSPAYAKSTTAGVELTNLKPGKYYWIKVRVISSKSAFLSGYGTTIKVRTRAATDFALLSPAALAAGEVSDSSIALTWAARGETDNYRVRWATSTKLTDAKYLRVTGAKANIADLSPGITYYLSVRVIDPAGADLSQYSPMVAVKTKARASFSPPTGVAASQITSARFTLSWTPLAGAPKYRVKYSTTPWTDPEYATAGEPSIELTGMTPKTTYYLKVRVLHADGSFASAYSTPIQVTTHAASAPLRVASYNVHCHTCSPSIADPAADDQPWTVRRDHVVDTIRKADPDVLALQEAQQSKLKSAGDTELAQFEDLAKRLGSAWALTNPNRYNCTNPDSNSCTFPAPLTSTPQGASSGTKIVYRTDRLVLQGQGTMQLTPLSATSTKRYVAWAFLQQRSTGKEFLFADIHLEPGNDSDDATVRDSWCGTSANPLCTRNRLVQARDALDKLNALNGDKLPIVLAGDAASSRAEVGGNLPYPVFTTQLVDPLGGTSYRAPVVAPAQTRINIAFNSVNKYDRQARRYAPSSETTYSPADNNLYNGAYNDYILVSPGVRISEFEQVLNVDATGRFVGVIPSDHNLIRATLWLP